MYRVRRIFQPARLMAPGAFHPDGLYGGRTRTSALTTGTAGISSRIAFSMHPIYQLSYTITTADCDELTTRAQPTLFDQSADAMMPDNQRMSATCTGFGIC